MPRNGRTGFTLIELLVVIAIIALLMSILMPALGQAKEHAKTLVCLTNLKGLGNAFNLYSGEHREFIPPMRWNKDKGAKTNDTWATLLEKEGLVTAPHGKNEYDFPNQSTLFKCPQGLMELWNGALPASHADPIGATALEQPSSGPDWVWGNDNDYFIHIWYGCNGTTFETDRFPMPRTPNDVGDWNVMHRLGEVDQVANVVGIYDGVWAHNCGSTTSGWSRINARHMSASICNVMLLDGHADKVPIEHLPTGGRLQNKNNYPDGATWPTWAINPAVP